MPNKQEQGRVRLPPLRWIALGSVIALVAAFLLVFDWNWFKGPLERRVSERTGRAFTISDLHVKLRWPLRVRLRDVRFANPEWASEPQMLELEQADFTIEFWPLLRGQLIFPELALTRPRIALERGPGKSNNWTFGDAAVPPEHRRIPVIGRLTVDDGLLGFHDPAAGTSVRVHAQTTQDPKSGASGLTFTADGRYRKNDLKASGHGGAVVSLADPDLPYDFDAKFRVGPTHGSAAGKIRGLATLAAVDVKLDLAGESFAELYPLTGVSLPPTPPYRVAGQLEREGSVWRFLDFDGRVGDSDVAGDMEVTRTPDRRLRLTARVESKLLDLDDLGGVIGAPVQAGPGETASAEQRSEAAEARASPRLLPDTPFRLERLRTMDADVTFTGRQIRSRDTPFDDLKAHILLEDGVLKAAPLDFGIGGGNVVARLTMDARAKELAVDGDFRIKRLDLRKLFPKSELAKKSGGLIGGRATISGRGNSFAEVLANGDGTLGVANSGGEVSNLLLEMVGLDAAEVLRFMFVGDKSVHMRCAVGDFELKDGVLHTRSAVIDTTDTNITITGSINLRDETLDLVLHPLPKDYSPFSLRSPLHVKGRFKKPSIRPDKTLLIKGGIAAILGAMVAPLALLIPLIETGPGDDADCERLIAAVERHAGAKADTGAPVRKAPTK